jgi:hypothetical protein
VLKILRRKRDQLAPAQTWSTYPGKTWSTDPVQHAPVRKIYIFYCNCPQVYKTMVYVMYNVDRLHSDLVQYKNLEQKHLSFTKYCSKVFVKYAWNRENPVLFKKSRQTQGRCSWFLHCRLIALWRFYKSGLHKILSFSFRFIGPWSTCPCYQLAPVYYICMQCIQ